MYPGKQSPSSLSLSFIMKFGSASETLASGIQRLSKHLQTKACFPRSKLLYYGAF